MLHLSNDLSAGLPHARIVDLTLLVAEDLPCTWPGHQRYQQKIFNWFATEESGGALLRDDLGPYQTRWMLMDEHTGTHVDAPSHGVPPLNSDLPGAGPEGEISAAEINLDQVVGPAVVIDVSPGSLLADRQASHDPDIGPDVLSAHESAHGEIKTGEIVLLRTGWDRYYVKGEAGRAYVEQPLRGVGPGWPAWTAEGVQALADRGVTCLGTDAPSIGGAGVGGPAHDVGFRAGMVFVEGLTGLTKLPTRGALFLALPWRLAYASGSPVRAVALVNGDSEQDGSDREQV